MDNHANEWTLLQNQFDSYEKHSLLIKLVNVVLVAAAVMIGSRYSPMLAVVAVLWLQDAIWKTFQERIGSRLLEVETLFSDPTQGNNTPAYQFNTNHLRHRPGVAGLVREYLVQAIRPTVAFPHAVLLLLLAVAMVAD